MKQLPSPTSRPGSKPPAYKNPARSATARVKDLLARMTLEEKAAQMVGLWQEKATKLVDASGNFDPAKAKAAFKKGHGMAEFTTVAGGQLTAMMDGKILVLTDEKGGKSRVTIADVRQSNGVIHVVDTILMPN